MDLSIGERIKSRNKQRLHEVNKRKRKETEAFMRSSVKKPKRNKPVNYDSDIEDVTPVHPTNATHKPSSVSGFEQNILVKKSFSRVFRDLNVEKAEPSSSALRIEFGKNTCVEDNKCLPEVRASENLVEVEIISDSESEKKVRTLAKRKLSMNSQGFLDSSSDDEEDDTSETKEEKGSKDDIKVESLSSSADTSSSSSSSSSSASSSSSSASSSSSSALSLSSSSSDKGFSLMETVGDTDDDDLIKTTPVRKVSKERRKPLKRSGPCLTKPGKKVKKFQKPNPPEEEKQKTEQEEEVKTVEKEQKVVYVVCLHCGKQNKGVPDTRSSCIKPPSLRDDFEDVNNFASSKDSVSNKSETHERPQRLELEKLETGKELKTLEKPSTSRPEIVSLEKAKEVQAPQNSASTNVSKFEEYVPINSGKPPERPNKPELENPEITKELKTFEMPKDLSFERAKEVQSPEKPSRPRIFLEKPTKVQADNKLEFKKPAVAVAVAEESNKSAWTNEPINDESGSSICNGDNSFDESEPSLKDKEVKSNTLSMALKNLNGNYEEVDIFRLLVNSVKDRSQLGEEEEEEEDKLISSSDEQSLDDQRKYDDDGLLIIRPPPLIERFGMEESESSPALSDSESENGMLWEDLAFLTKSNDIGNQLRSHLLQIEEQISIDQSHKASCKRGDHDLCLDLEIGLKCIHCGFVEREIQSMDQYELGENPTIGRKRMDRFEEEGSSNLIEQLLSEAPNKNNLDEGCVSSEGTVWDKIPGVKSQMYPHQQEGFEFIWRNLAGTIILNELKNFENSDETGGCIMSHAPGTGKTRLTIMFLQSYLECFPNCKAVIIAPASLLLTWAEEFKKWEISIPFHNLNSLEFTGKESPVARKLLMQKNASARTNNEIRMVKIYSWKKARSILGISYSLYEKLAGVRDEGKKTKVSREVKTNRELDDIREILMDIPGLLVLDEAHTPRNQRSCIWKTLSKVETQKRILLSGTPFQNNFQELCNVLGLARPKYLERLTSTLKKSGMTVVKKGKRALGDDINNRGIEELKTVMFPFVHVHKGSILQKSLPGLRECVVVLNPPELQKRVLESIEVTHNFRKKNVFETEHKLSLVSVHPSLVSRCKLSEKERLSIDEELLIKLKKFRLDPNQSVKTKFLMEFIGLCEVIKEKVLVFSQYIDPLKLIMKHLVSRFKWNQGEEVLYMHGKLDQKQRQTLINEFNDPKSKAKVFLASTKACSEGINLVGASRVILLDVVWNPAVERQAISRAYRIGQKKIVYTYHLVAKGTPEGPKYCKQARKDRISELVFACSSKQEKGKEKIAEAVIEDKVLDNMVKHLKLRDMFDNLIVQPKEADLVEGFNILM